VRRACRLFAWLLCGPALAVTHVQPARAVDLEKLVMPGEVIQGHADLESDCQNCHRAFDRTAQTDLCRNCHEPVRDDLKAGTGFHGRAPGVRDTDCSACHADHKGRGFDAVALDVEAFDHDLTDRPLRGAHAALACGTCHERDAKHREAASDCGECHRDDDVHAGKLGADCGECHGEQTWGEARFDHDATDFPLRGRHRKVDCGLCHADTNYQETPSDCISCHRLDDAHRGRFGSRCGDCHSPAAWKESRFDHDRMTDFPLVGRHRQARCESCHVGGIHARKLSSGCVSCHAADDVHRERNGTRCESCHSARGWGSASFDHDAETDFPLRGAHRELRCESCHTGTLGKEKLETTCHGCHRNDDVHRGQLGDACETCHDERGFGERIVFDHDLTRFPLLGMHAAASCDQCHLTQRFKDTKLDCYGCHADDDLHRLRLGPDCALCHNPNDWALWRFDHDTQTDFALHGAHEDLDCHSCHRVPARHGIDLRGSCGACHAADDAHLGAYGPHCGRCHSEEAWDQIRLSR
jgi:hypothetical protein